MARYQCSVCGYVYDEDSEGTAWAALPDTWTCPICSTAKSNFELLEADTKPTPTNRATMAHRVFGYIFLAIYLVLLVQMIPRLWTYQIEFPARSVVHISLGMAIGTILLVKIAIVRFFLRLDHGLVPMLGTSILVGSVVLIGISAPAAFREALATASLFTEENRERVRILLAEADLDETQCERFSSTESLRAGQRVLRQDCTACHDLRTVLAKPRTPQNWRQTVRRMADRTTLINPLDEDKQWQVTAYLIALSPQLQRSVQQMRDERDRRSQSMQAAKAVAGKESRSAAYDAAEAKRLFEAKCSQCHKTSVVTASPPGSEDQARKLVAMMVEEGLEANEEELSTIVRYLTETYAKSPE
jgi:rubredoxin/cytochrome c5